MKYLEYNYQVNKPLSVTFPYLIDLMSLHEELNYFEQAELSTNGLEPDQVGKCYYVVTKHGDITVTCTIELVKIDPPERIMLEYTYQVAEKGRMPSNGNAFLPWDSMSCIIGFEEQNGKTRVTSLMYANGVNTVFKKMVTWFLSLFNRFQQKKVIKKVVEALNSK